MLHFYGDRLLVSREREWPRRLVADHIGLLFVHVDRVETGLECLAIAADPVEGDVHPVLHVVKRKARRYAPLNSCCSHDPWPIVKLRAVDGEAHFG